MIAKNGSLISRRHLKALSITSNAGYRETQSEYIRNKITEYMSHRPCPTCKGLRLRPESMAVTVDDKNIVEVTDWPVLETLDWTER